MKARGNSFIIFGVILTIGGLFIALFPTSFRTTRYEKGRVTGVVEAGMRSVALQLSGHQGRYYLRRGLEYLSLNDLRSLKGKEVTLVYVDRESPLEPYHQDKQVSELQAGGELLFRESDETDDGIVLGAK